MTYRKRGKKEIQWRKRRTERKKVREREVKAKKRDCSCLSTLLGGSLGKLLRRPLSRETRTGPAQSAALRGNNR